MARLEVAPKLWQKGTCACLDAPLGITGCLYTALCPCIAICDVAEMGGDNKFLACCCGHIPCVGGFIRKNFREVTNIEGGYLGDCLCHCGPLHFFSLCQELNELKVRTGDTDSKNYGIKAGVKYDVEAIKASIAQQNGGGAQAPQQGGFAPPQQGGYAPQQGGYAPQQQGGYPPQQGGYPPQQQGGYPPQQGGYPPQQGGYPPQQQQQMSYPQQY